MEELEERQAIIAAVTDYAVGIDLRDWDRLRRSLADDLLVDFTSWRGGRDLSLFPQPVRKRGDEWVDGVRRSMSSLKATHHLLGNFVVEPDVKSDNDRTRRVIAYVQATHYLPNEHGDNDFTLGGYYDNRVTNVGGRWVISELRLVVLWSRGNRFVFNLAYDIGG